jgi:hypothetical protein
VAVTGLLLLPLVVLVVLGLVLPLVIVLVVTAALVATLSARIVIDDSGLRITSLGLAWSKVPLERVESASTRTVSPFGEFGSWGWRIAIDGTRGYVTRRGEALVVHRVGEPDVVVTIDEAGVAAATLNTLVARAG